MKKIDGIITGANWGNTSFFIPEDDIEKSITEMKKWDDDFEPGSDDENAILLCGYGSGKICFAGDNIYKIYSSGKGELGEAEFIRTRNRIAA